MAASRRQGSKTSAAQCIRNEAAPATRGRSAPLPVPSIPGDPARKGPAESTPLALGMSAAPPAPPPPNRHVAGERGRTRREASLLSDLEPPGERRESLFENYPGESCGRAGRLTTLPLAIQAAALATRAGPFSQPARRESPPRGHTGGLRTRREEEAGNSHPLRTRDPLQRFRVSFEPGKTPWHQTTG